MVLRVDPAGVGSETDNGPHNGTLRAPVFCADARQRAVGELRQMKEMNLREDTRQHIPGEGIRYSALVLLGAPGARIKVVICDRDHDKIASRVFRPQ